MDIVLHLPRRTEQIFPVPSQSRPTWFLRVWDELSDRRLDADGPDAALPRPHAWRRPYSSAYEVPVHACAVAYSCRKTVVAAVLPAQNRDHSGGNRSRDSNSQPRPHYYSRPQTYTVTVPWLELP